MPHDAKGELLKVGDEVIIRAKVTAINSSPDFCNCDLDTAIPMPPYTTPSKLILNTKQVEKVG